MMHKTEYYPNTHGLKNIYNKLLSLGATINNHSVIEYDDTVKQVDYFEYIYEHR